MTDANTASSNTQDKDAKQAVGTCPFSEDKVQLIPLRFGLTETLAATGQTKPSFKTESKPMGVRLLRDGWLYILIKEQEKWLLHEYQISNGKLDKLLWLNHEVTSDVRTNSVGEPNLIFPMNCSIYCCYSEIQWTAVKCSQVISSDIDRNRFMQKVSISCFTATNGAKNLLTEEQAKEIVAEHAEHKASESSENSYKPYQWEHKKLCKNVEFQSIKESVKSKYQNAHLYLVINDDIGVLRDLAAYQSLIAQSIEDWQSDKKRYQKYVEGCYIETQLNTTPQKIDSIASAYGNNDFSNELTQTQKNSICDWINEYDEKYHDFHRPTVEEKFRAVKKSLGPELMAEYKELLYDIQERIQDQNHGISPLEFTRIFDTKYGSQGIRDLIKQKEMESFLENEREKLSSWMNKLKLINNDRINLFGRFYHSAWYFDASSSPQLKEMLAAEYSCIQDLCINDEASKAVAEKLEKMPWVAAYRALTTLPATQYDKISEEILKSIDGINKLFTHDNNVEQLNSLITNTNQLISQHLNSSEMIRLDEQLKSFSQIIDSTFTPAQMLEVSNITDEFLAKANSGSNFDPNTALRNLTGAAWMGIFSAYNTTGISIGLSNTSELAKFEQLTNLAKEIRDRNKKLKHKIRKKWSDHRKKGGAGKPDVKEWKLERKTNQVQLKEIETKISNALLPFGEGPEKSGYYIKGLTPAQHSQVKQMAADYRATKNIKAWSNVSGWDGLSLVLTVFAVYNAAKTYNSSSSNFSSITRDVAGALSAGFGLAQGLRAGFDKAAFELVTNSQSKLVYGAKLGKWTSVLGLGAYAFGSYSSGVKTIEAYKKFSVAMKTGNRTEMLKHSIDLVAEGSLTAANIYGFGRSSHAIWAVFTAEQASKAAIWASNGGRLLAIGARINMIGVIATAIQLVSTIGYNYFNRSSYLKWFEDSCWGHSNKNQNLTSSNEALAKITSKPVVSLKNLPKGKVLSIFLPSISLDLLDEANVSISAYWMIDLQKNNWIPWSEAIEQQWVCLSKPEQPLELGIPIFPNEFNASSCLGLEIQYLATPDSKETTTVRYQTLSLNQLGKLSEVSMLKVRNPSKDNVRLLTSSQLI